MGILLILFGSVFALQGDGMVGGSSMTGNPFWIYAGSGVAIIGVILAILGFGLGSRSGAKKAFADETTPKMRDDASMSSSTPQTK